MTKGNTDTKESALATVQSRITEAAKLAGRKADDVSLIAVSKTQPAAAIKALIEQGHRTFGENRLQEAQDKWPGLKRDYPEIELHMVGQLQSNKAADTIELFDAIHSVDRPSLIKALGKAMASAGRTIPCFIQVNIGEEPQKGGCDIDKVGDLLSLARDHGVPVVGLMCVPPLGIEPAPYFALLKKKATELGVAQTSMGMSNDFETAVMLGASHVRVGSALFGSRSQT